MTASVSLFTVKSTLSLFSAYQYSGMNTSRIFFSDEDAWFICLRPRHFVDITIRRTLMLPPLVTRPYKTKNVTKCWPNKKRDRYGLAYSSLSLCSYSIRIVFELVSLQPLDTHYFVPDVKGDVFCFIFVPHAHTFCTPQSTVTQVLV